jgi:hypothetical protein
MFIAKQFKVDRGNVAVYLAVLCPFPGTFFMGDKQMGCTSEK